MRRTCTPVLFGFLMFASICTNARADPIRLTFDDVAPGIYLSNLYGQFGVHLISGASFPDGGAAGITEVSIVASEDAVSAPNILRPRPPTFELFTDIIGFFFNQEETLLTDSLSMTIVGADSSPEPWSIRLIGLGGYLDTFVGTGNHVFS